MEKESYLSIREKGFEDIQNVIQKMENNSKKIRTIITPLEKKLIDELKQNCDDPTFWF